VSSEIDHALRVTELDGAAFGGRREGKYVTTWVRLSSRVDFGRLGSRHCHILLEMRQLMSYCVGMDEVSFGIGELADAAGLSRRAIRFYVQQKLVPPPNGRGRGDHYDRRHLDQLRRVLELQRAGHSLDAIRRLLSPSDSRGFVQEERGGDLGPAVQAGSAGDSGPAAEPLGSLGGAVKASLWTRVSLGEGIELSFDATRFNPTAEQLLRLRQRVREELL
jgi:DNA-binding transcriptional MerR regulator